MTCLSLYTYAEYAWPQVMGKLYRRNGRRTAAGLALFSLPHVVGHGQNVLPQCPVSGIFPHNTLGPMFGAGLRFRGTGFDDWRAALLAQRLHRRMHPHQGKPAAALEATAKRSPHSIPGRGHGEGSNNADDQFTQWWWRFHLLTFYGFMLCFAATGVATLYHFLLVRRARCLS